MDWNKYKTDDKLQKFFDKNIYRGVINTCFGKKVSVYADFTASGQLFRCVEQFMENKIYPYYANTHSNAYNGKLMVHYIQKAKDIIRKSIGGNSEDSVIFTGQGCSTAITHFIHILNLSEKTKKSPTTDKDKPIVFITCYEHNSNYLPWCHANVDLKIIPTSNNGLIDLKVLEEYLKKYKDRSTKIISFSAGSNISGIVQDISAISKLGHKYKYLVAFDFAAVAPYIKINLHVNDKEGDYIDAIFLSPHKFLGGPNTPGILVANNKIFCNKCPFYPSGGTVRYASKDHKIYSTNNEVKEMGGTPNILGCIKAGLIFHLKDILFPYIKKKEKALVEYVRPKLNGMKNVHVVIPNCSNDPNITQVPIFSFVIPKLHYNFIVVLLNDLFGIQTRGGVSCAGIYAEKILKINKSKENQIIDSIVTGKGVPKDYGWCRVTFHYSMPYFIVEYILNAIEFVAKYGIFFLPIYEFSIKTNLWQTRERKKTDVFANENLTFYPKYKSCDGICMTELDAKKNIKEAKKLVLDITNPRYRKSFVNKNTKLEKKIYTDEEEPGYFEDEREDSGSEVSKSDERDTFSMT